MCTRLPRAFRNGTTIGRTPKNEVLRVKSLKEPILQEIKESSKFGNYGPPSGNSGIRVQI